MRYASASIRTTITTMTQPGISWLRSLPTAYFALIMATGITSITAQLHGHSLLARMLLVLNVVQYAILAVLYSARIVRFTDEVVKDIGDHLRGPGFFTVVAGTGVLGSQFYVVAGMPVVGNVLSAATICLWLVILYSVFALLIIKEDPPTLEKGINGGWLVSIVATQSVSLVSCFMGTVGGGSDLWLVVGLGTWCFGVMLYIWIISLIFYRYMFYSMKPGDLSPPYWINMGAVAISTLAGCNLLGASSSHPLLMELRPFLKGLTFLLWSTATWWIPMLLILGFWRHVAKRFPFQYDPLYWGMVFPLGMYSACTFRLAREMDLPVVLPLARLFLFIGGGVWSLVFIGLLRTVARGLMPSVGKSGTIPDQGQKP